MELIKRLTFKEWYESEGFEEMRFGSSDMVNVNVCGAAFRANDKYIDSLENPFSEQIRAKDKWINELLKEVSSLKGDNILGNS